MKEVNEQMNEQMNEWINKQTKEQMNEWMNEPMNGWMNEQMNEWMMNECSLTHFTRFWKSPNDHPNIAWYWFTSTRGVYHIIMKIQP